MQNLKFKMQKLNSRMPVFAFCILHFALVGLVSACSARVKADTVPVGPPLAVPVAPAHEIAIEQVAEAAPPEEPPAPEPTTPSPKPVITKPQPRTQPRAETASPPTTPPAVAPPPQAEAATVRATPAAGSAAEERKVRDLLFRASESLKKVPYDKLSTEGRAQYDQSKRFSGDAEQAIKERNFVYALTLAEKAATLASELVR
jgi:hypothetical protein